jgi:hypothetical protein
MITASMSTVAWREPGLARAVASLLPQVDRLNVFLQGYDSVPSCLDHPRVSAVLGGPDTAFGASAKFRWLWDGAVADGYHFAVDDDIEYPPDYVRYCVRKIDDYGRKAIVGFHGAIYKSQVRRYFKDRHLWHFERECDSDRFVHMLGTGTTAMHASALRLSRDDFERPNSCDLYLGIAAQRQQVPMVCLARHRGYLKPLPLSGDTRAVAAPAAYAARMVEIWQTWKPWEINECERVTQSASPVVVVVPCYNESNERIERTVASALVTPGVDLVRVVDDGSDVPVSPAPRAKLDVMRCPSNGGPSAALNVGIRSLPDDAIVCRLDVGDEFYPEPKSRQIAMVKAGAPAVASARFDPVAERVVPIANGWKRGIFGGCQFANTATVFTKQTWLDVGGYDESLRWCDDWRFSAAVQAHVGWQIMNEATGSHGEFPGGHSDVRGESKARRQADRARVVEICHALASPDKHAHLFDEDWCRKRGVIPIRKP